MSPGCPPRRKGGELQAGSRPIFQRLQDFAPGPALARASFRLGTPSGEFYQMPVGHFRWLDRLGQNIPDPVNQIEAFADTESLDLQRFETYCHSWFSSDNVTRQSS